MDDVSFRLISSKKIANFLQHQFELFERGTKLDSTLKHNMIKLSAEGMSHKGVISIGTSHNIPRTHSPHSLVSIDYKKMVKLVLCIWIKKLNVHIS